MKAIILARVSTEEQKDAGNSLPAQTDRMIKYCQKKEFPIVKKYSFDEGAYRKKRDDFDKMIDYIKKSKEKLVICFDKVDRFSRNVFDKRISNLYEMTMQDKIEMHFVSDNLIINSNISAVEKFHFAMNLGLAKYYSDAISDNVKRAFEGKIKRGEWLTKAPIGYLNEEDPVTKRKIIIIDKQRAYLVQEIFNLYATGSYSIRGLANLMKKKGLTNNKPPYNYLSHSRLNHVITNPFYYGIMKVKGNLEPHNHGNLISKELFDRCQDVILGYHKKPFKWSTIHTSVLGRGMMECADCGCAISSDKKKNKYIYLKCTESKGKHGAKRMEEKKLLKQINKILDLLVIPDDILADLINQVNQTHQTKIEYHKNSITQLQTEYTQIQTSLDTLLDLCINRSITQDEYDKKAKDLKNRQYDITQSMKDHTEADEKFVKSVTFLLNICSKAPQIFAKSSEIDKKRQLLKFVFSNLQLKDENIIYKLKTPFDLLLQAKECSYKLRGWVSNPRPTG